MNAAQSGWLKDILHAFTSRQTPVLKVPAPGIKPVPVLWREELREECAHAAGSPLNLMALDTGNTASLTV